MRILSGFTMEIPLSVKNHISLLPAFKTEFLENLLPATVLFMPSVVPKDVQKTVSDSFAAKRFNSFLLTRRTPLSLMNQNALVFADAILVPVACDYLSLVGVRQVLKTVKNVNQLLHHPEADAPQTTDHDVAAVRNAASCSQNQSAAPALPPPRPNSH